MNRGWLSFLGIVLSAGGLVTGEEMVVKAVQSQKVYLVIIAEDISANTYKKVTDKCKFYNVECIQRATSEEIGDAIGKSFRKVIGVTDRNLAKALKNKIK
ncbi:MAG: ribosomal L7Ae/L30e/S12e/Gadd45 family protein [Turicibacter sp.]|nr:ribosomal L7Ae/L30e/S12e/Gadd45 family protein [Turicibacter sp.]